MELHLIDRSSARLWRELEPGSPLEQPPRLDQPSDQQASHGRQPAEADLLYLQLRASALDPPAEHSVLQC